MQSRFLNSVITENHIHLWKNVKVIIVFNVVGPFSSASF